MAPILPNSQAEHWQWRALELTGYNTSKLGLIVMAVVGIATKHPPVISTKRGAVIDEDGFVLADLMMPGQTQFYATKIGSLRDIVDNFRRVADMLKLDDIERLQMFDMLRKWAGTDLRARKNTEIRNH